MENGEEKYKSLAKRHCERVFERHRKARLSTYSLMSKESSGCNRKVDGDRSHTAWRVNPGDKFGFYSRET